jgi:hypothetical protein
MSSSSLPKLSFLKLLGKGAVAEFVNDEREQEGAKNND